jgi:acyl-CoA synthetase (AMP-forming)/AMP-acid ligase II
MWRYADIRTVPDIIRHWSSAVPRRVALAQGSRQVTYGELGDRSSRIANALLASGAGPGSHIGFLGKNSAEFYEVWLGATKAGGAIAPFNWRSSPAELAELIDDAQAPVVFVSEELLGTLEEVRRQSHTEFEIVSFSADGSPDHLGRWLQPHPPSDPRIPLTGTETALLAYTSGTTGRPKGVQLSHDAFHYSFLCSALEPSLGLQDDDVLLMVMPNFHLAGSWVSLPALYHGAKIAILPFFEPAATLRAIRQQRPTVVCLVPTAMQMILDHADVAATDFSTLRRMLYAGSPIGAETLQRAIDVFRCDLVQFYGTTEMWIISVLGPEHHDPGKPAHLTSCGTPLPFVEIRVVDAELKDVPDGTVGELIVRSPVMFSGYWNQPDTTARAMAGGWYRTSDLGRREADGYYYIVDRARDMIITGGENVYSIEVERALAKHPGVAAVAVVGEPDEKWGEKVTAFVVLAPGAAAHEDDLRAHCRGLIAGYKVPKSIRIESSLPMTASGKIQKAELRRRLSADLVSELARSAGSR